MYNGIIFLMLETFSLLYRNISYHYIYFIVFQNIFTYIISFGIWMHKILEIY